LILAAAPCASTEPYFDPAKRTLSLDIVLVHPGNAASIRVTECVFHVTVPIG
jgi:hypothetical protein